MLEGLEPPTKGYTCKIRTILKGLDSKDKAIMESALADEAGWPHKTLSNALAIRGIKVTDNSIARHRKGLCSC